jgi:hypothetical protein
MVMLPELHHEFHGWKRCSCTTQDLLILIESPWGDLFDPVNMRDMKRLRALTLRLQLFQSERGVQRVRYHLGLCWLAPGGMMRVPRATRFQGMALVDRSE